MSASTTSEVRAGDIAIVGMAGRFPGARNRNEFWRNLCSGVESIRHFTPAELEVNDAKSQGAPNYVRARAIMADVDQFDAAFFGIYPKEAELIDPQQRVFLECCWEAFEDAGYDPLRYSGIAGVYAGCSPNSYFLENVCAERAFIERYTAGYQVSNFVTTLGANFEFLPTRVAYKLNLRGPAFSMNCGCSTSLVAIAQASLALQNYQCDMALAGGVSITFPQRRGYLHEAGGMVSADGHCRTFDAAADGTVFGDGGGVVLLKRMEDALNDGDHIYAVIRGFGLNNDGAAKVGFTAPGVDGQAQAIAMAQAAAEIDPATISYIEAHGTATPLGDPIEIAALTQAFRRHTAARGFCAIGTAKANVGHLDVAAGVTGLIKTALSLHHRMLPPQVNFQRANPALNLDESPFYVNTELTAWRNDDAPLRAGVSAFGIGGTNAHIVLEEAPPYEAGDSARSQHLLLLSAKSAPALEVATVNLATHLTAQPDESLADVAYTLMAGRHPFEHRRMIVATDSADAAQALTNRDRQRVFTQSARPERLQAAFMFPGQGAQYIAMGRGLYTAEASFRAQVDECLALIDPQLAVELRRLLLTEEAKADEISQTRLAQPSLFIVEYALARLLIEYGIQPSAMIGHSVGEFVAATVAAVFSLDDALRIVAARGQLMQAMLPGAMLAVRLPENAVSEFLSGEVNLAAINAPALTVIAGPTDAIVETEAKLDRAQVTYRRLRTSHAFHSSMMEPVVDGLTETLRSVRLNPPAIPFISGVTGDWIRAEEATDPSYWGRHLRLPVRFADGIAKLRSSGQALVEVGPGNTLATLARQHPGGNQNQLIFGSMPDASRSQTEEAALLGALGRLWLHGVEPVWAKVCEGEQRQRVALPTYPFERKRFWMDRQFAVPARPPLPEMLTEETATPQEQSNFTRNGAPSAALETDQSQSMDQTMPAHREAHLQALLAAIFEDLSGIDVTAIGSSVTFLEMGFDSLFLTQVSQAILAQFGIKITFRQLLDKLATLGTLANYLDQTLAPDAFRPSAPAAPVEPITAPLVPPVMPPANAASMPQGIPSAPVCALEELCRKQLETLSDVMAKQLELLRSAGVVASNGTSLAPVQAAAAPQPPIAPLVPVAKPEATVQEVKQSGRFRPIEGASAGDLTPAQQVHLSALIARFNQRTARSKAHVAANRRVLADPRNAAGFRREWKELVYPIVAARSKGSKIWDLDGNEYIDVVNGFGPIMLGHAPDLVTAAVTAQLEQGWETGPQSALAGEVAALICELTGMDRASFCTTGSEAVVAALRLARTVTGRSKVVLFNGSYHGMFDEVLVKSVGAGTAVRSLPLAPGIPREKVGNVIVLDYGSAEALQYIEEHASELAAVMVEPVQSRHPTLQPVEFLRAVRRITERAGSALIFDEVVTGFRVHQGGAQALFGIRADIATYGKVIGGGFPIGVVAGRAQFMDALDGGPWDYGDESFPETGVTFFAGTFFRHPIALAAARAVLHHFKSAGPELQVELGRKADRLSAGLNAALADRGVATKVETFGSISYFGFPAEWKFASLFYYYLRERGIFIQEGFPLFITTEHSDADLARIVGAFGESLDEALRAGFLPHDQAAHGSITKPIAAPPAPLEVAVQRYPLSEAQQEIWLAASLSEAASCCFNESLTIALQGDLEAEALLHAVNQVVARHDALRTIFSPDGEFQQSAPALTVALAQTNLSGLSEAERAAQLEALIAKDAASPFDLSNGPLIRVQLIAMSPRDYRLMITTHHIVCDGWSTNVMLDELAQIYNATRGNDEARLPVAMQFKEYVVAELQARATVEHSAAEEYWEKQFSQPVTPLDLPTDRPRRARKEYAGATYRTTIDAATTQRLRQAGARERSTLFATLLAGFEALLARLSNQDDIVVGIPTAGQSLSEGENLVGHCVNFLPVRGHVDLAEPFAALLARTRQQVLDAYDHQGYTYGALIRRVKVQREAGRLPLLDVQFNVERVGEGMNFGGLAAKVEANAKHFVNFDLFLNIVESADGLVLDCDYSGELFDEATIRRWLGHYATLLTSVADGMTQEVGRLPLLSAAAKSELVTTWNQTEADYPRDRLVHQLFEEQAARQPGAIAAMYAAEALTYAELNGRANQIANYLRRLGVAPGAVVGIFLERSLDLVIALLGIMKAGCTYLPLDPIYPEDRIRFALEETAAAAILTHSDVQKLLPATSSKCVWLDKDARRIGAESETVRPAAISPGDPAYVIYTSGSTGQPKGVTISHRALVNLLIAMSRRPGLSPTDSLLAVTTLSFDIAGLELLGPLVTGGRTIIASRAMTLDGAQLLAAIEQTGVTVMQATPTTWRMLLEAGWSGNPRLKMLCGGEALPRDLAARLIATGGELWNMYGPTETTIWSSCALIEDEQQITVGRPIANTQFYVLDHYGELAPIGVAGELYIGGDGVAQGYFKRPELTAEKFVSDRISSRPEARLFRTGDLVRYTGRGEMVFLGRGDNQVKLRGYRIELGEIEAAIARHPAVKEAAVALVRGRRDDARLIAYLVCRPTQNAAAAELRMLIRRQLPEYMVPAVFVEVESLPRTSNGKLDRKALMNLGSGSEDEPRAGSEAEPQTPEERTLCSIWREVLGVDRIGVNDDIFELGGDSVHIYRIVARARKANLAVAALDIFEHRTIAEVLRRSAEAPSAEDEIFAPVTHPLTNGRTGTL